jgi:hypothetical protein
MWLFWRPVWDSDLAAAKISCLSAYLSLMDAACCTATSMPCEQPE